MAGPIKNKRGMAPKFQRPMKRQKRERRVQKEYHSSTEDEEDVEADQQQQDDEQGFDAVNLLDSDDDIHNARVDDVGDDDVSGMSSSEDEATTPKQQKKKAGAAKGSAKLKAKIPAKKMAKDDNSDDDNAAIAQQLNEVVGGDTDDDDDDDEDDEDLNDEFDLGSDDDNDSRKPKKRNDPAAFATSLSKILSTKLATSKRADPVLARSAAAHATSKAVLDSALEAKAKRQLRDQKRRAQEKGRVKDVLVATTVVGKIEPEVTTAEIMAAEAKLRKVAQRGVVKMFNAVRAAQVKSGEAERATKQVGMLGMARREEKVNEMSKKGFLDLLASGGGGLKKGGIEEA